MRPAAIENLLTRSELSRGERRFEGTCSAFASLDSDSGTAWKDGEMVRTRRPHPADVDKEDVLRGLERAIGRIPRDTDAGAFEDALSDLRYAWGLTEAQLELARAEESNRCAWCIERGINPNV